MLCQFKMFVVYTWGIGSYFISESSHAYIKKFAPSWLNLTLIQNLIMKCTGNSAVVFSNFRFTLVFYNQVENAETRIHRQRGTMEHGTTRCHILIDVIDTLSPFHSNYSDLHQKNFSWPLMW